MTASSAPKTVLVTGATDGIGRVTALELARRGYRVLITSRDAAKGERVLDEVRAQGGSTAPELLIGDLSSMGTCAGSPWRCAGDTGDWTCW